MSIQQHLHTPNLPAVIFRTADLAAHYRDVRRRLRGPIEPPLIIRRPGPASVCQAADRVEVVATPRAFLAPTTEGRTLDALGIFERLCGERPGSDRAILARAAVARAWNVSEFDLLTRSRRVHIVVPRQIAMAIARHLSERTLFQIGQAFRGMDHTTVLHAARKREALVKGMLIWRARFVPGVRPALPAPNMKASMQ